MKVKTAGGHVEELLPGNRRVIGKPVHEVTRERGIANIHMRDKSAKNLRKRIKGLARKYPKLNSHELVERVVESREYRNDPAGVKFSVGGPLADRSIVKAATALAFAMGVRAECCDLAIDYLRTEEVDYQEGCYFDYYAKDLVTSRPRGLPLNCVYVAGKPGSRLLLAYVELFGVVRRVICLSRKYKMDAISGLCAVDPVSGKELQDIVVDLDDTILESARSQMYNDIVGGRYEALNTIVGSGIVISRRRELRRVVEESWTECLSVIGKKEGDEWTLEDKREFSECMANSVAPLLTYYMEPMSFPEDFDPSDVN